MGALGFVVLAGGASTRMGQDKAALVRGTSTLLGDVVASCGDAEVVVVGPAGAADLVARPVRLTLEDPPGGGPCAGLAAGLAVLPPSCDVVQVLSCDLPGAAGVVAVLDGLAMPDDAALVPVDDEGFRQYLAGRYPRAALAAALAGDVHGASIRGRLGSIPRRDVALAPELLVDVDDPAAAAAAGYELRNADGGAR